MAAYSAFLAQGAQRVHASLQPDLGGGFTPRVWPTLIVLPRNEKPADQGFANEIEDTTLDVGSEGRRRSGEALNDFVESSALLDRVDQNEGGVAQLAIGESMPRESHYNAATFRLSDRTFLDEMAVRRDRDASLHESSIRHGRELCCLLKSTERLGVPGSETWDFERRR